MTEEELHVWENGVPVGVFHNDKTETSGLNTTGMRKRRSVSVSHSPGNGRRKPHRRFLRICCLMT